MQAKSAKVLAVDDRDENLVALTAVLDALPVEVVAVTSGQAALKELLNDEFALILLDVIMPGMDGFETAQHIKGRARTRDVPIIFLTAAGDAGDDAYRGYAAGAVDYLTKPFDPWLLRAKVSVFVDLHRREAEVRRRAELLRRALPSDENVPALLNRQVGQVEAAVARLRAKDAELPLSDVETRLDELRTTVRALLS
ncbi:response regulator [Actinomadura rayongensis]|uniref:Response regulator n=1 Tax=Actinomadura rayongensis TaxID=1429076 RepID=A0A6I4WM08_9ACTN|nr:response regulator [Actinomadura rayongensis]